MTAKEYVRRPEKLGLGATPAAMLPKSKKYIKQVTTQDTLLALPSPTCSTELMGIHCNHPDSDITLGTGPLSTVYRRDTSTLNSPSRPSQRHLHDQMKHIHQLLDAEQCAVMRRRGRAERPRRT